MSGLSDISTELELYRYNNGFKLLSPDYHKKTRKVDPKLTATGLTVATVLALPMDVYFYTTASTFLLVNEHLANTTGFNSPHDAFGKSPLAVLFPESALELIINNERTMKTNSRNIIEENVIRKYQSPLRGMTFKSPWYDEDNNILGVIGYSIIYGMDPLVESIAQLAELGLLNQNFDLSTRLSRKSNSLSPRESQVIYHLIRGKTAKGIATQLALSTRTVETHLINIKNKFNVRSKMELIDKILGCAHLPDR
jgi:DNA-binding CsgD family transcriptional regulator